MQWEIDPAAEDGLMLLGTMAARQLDLIESPRRLRDVEFKVFSQFGDDGIVHYLTTRIAPSSTTFIEFGVEDYLESNTRFLLMHQNWSGFVMDGSPENIARLSTWPILWKYDLQACAAFIDRDNINALLAVPGFPKALGLLHIDLDGNDYWVWERITAVEPTIVIVEYNSVFGMDRPISVPYDPSFNRTRAHSSNLFWGSSLAALHHLAQKKGYAFVGCNSAGNNAYFVRRDQLRGGIAEVSLADGYVASRYRESRDPQGRLTYLRADERIKAIRGTTVVNVTTMAEEPL